MTDEQILAIKCAYATLVNVQHAHDNGSDYDSYDWEVHRQRIGELEAAFPELELANMSFALI